MNAASTDSLLARLVEPAALERRPVRLLFVCTGNICRSPLAHALFDHLADERAVSRFFETESAGTSSWHVGENADDRMRATARRHGVVLDHPARVLRPEDLSDFDLLLAMDSGHAKHMRQMARGDALAADKVVLFRDFEEPFRPGREVPDPYYGGTVEFEAVYAMVERCAGHMLDRLLAVMKARAAGG